ncbi:MAG: tRNA (adenosine(37)-N6)-dimethylallyltransferase MiaA [Oscillospiraceae bacterium]|nr:tRNA (adenosine(37)-N6)-dimethylallyltransferase MiaA [Oscillospiraceae bacterium]
MSISLLVVCGPTASGKTSLAIELCEQHGGEVVSADSMQVYRGMDIATAKPSARQLARVPHHLISVIEPSERFSVEQYCKLAHAAIADIHSRGKLPVLCGGTGLYIRAVMENWQLTEGEIKHETEGTWHQLHEVDPAAALNIHPNDSKRINHALALFHSTGVTLTAQNEQSHRLGTPYDAQMIYLVARDRQVLYDRINARVDEMLAQGLVEEAQAMPQGTAAQAIGHKELQPYLRGESSLEACVENLKRETRRYAKRQITYFGRMARERSERCETWEIS